MTETIHGGQASNKTTDETKNTRRKNETPSDENERTTTTTKGNWSHDASFSKHTTRTRRDDRGIPFIISPDPLPPAPLSSAGLK